MSPAIRAVIRVGVVAVTGLLVGVTGVRAQGIGAVNYGPAPGIGNTYGGYVPNYYAPTYLPNSLYGSGYPGGYMLPGQTYMLPGPTIAAYPSNYQAVLNASAATAPTGAAIAPSAGYVVVRQQPVRMYYAAPGSGYNRLYRGR